MKKAIIIQGAPGVGKTTLARRLSDDLGITYISKDNIKESLYDSCGVPIDKSESELYGRIAIRAMYAGMDEFIKAGKVVIVEAPLLQSYAVSDLAPIASVDELLQIHVYCDPQVQEARFSSRAEDGSRHAGHIDKTIDARVLQERHKALPGIDKLSVDTTHFTDEEYQELLGKVRNIFKEGM